MKPILFILFALALSLPALGQPFSFGDEAVFGGAAVPPAAACGFWTNSITGNVDYWGSGLLSQGVSNSTSTSVCRVAVRFANPSDHSEYCLELRTAANGGGTLLGTSATNDAAISASYLWHTNEFATPVTTSGTFYITRRVISGGNFNWSASTTNAFSDATISSAYSGASSKAPGDFEFALWRVQ